MWNLLLNRNLGRRPFGPDPGASCPNDVERTRYLQFLSDTVNRNNLLLHLTDMPVTLKKTLSEPKPAAAPNSLLRSALSSAAHAARVVRRALHLSPVDQA